MIPKNEPVVQKQNSAKALSWMDRMQLKLETLCETEAASNPNHLVQETSAYLEKQISTATTNMRKFCAEFVKEVLLPDTPDVSCEDTLRTDVVLNTGFQTGPDKPSKLATPEKLVDAPLFNPEGSMSQSSLGDGQEVKVVETEEVKEVSPDPVTFEEAMKSSTAEDILLVPTVSQQSVQQLVTEDDSEQYAYWFVSEEYRKMRIGKSISTSSLQSCEDLQRAPSSDSLLDWELV